MKMVSFIVLLFFLAAMPAFAQAQQACTEIGCIDGIVLRGDEGRDWKTGNYIFSFILDGRQVQCHGELPLKPCEEGLSLSCNKKGIQITESGCALPASQHAFGDIIIAGDPRKVMVRITHNNQTIVTRTIVPQYTTLQPNGTGCGPVCKSAAYNLFNAD